MHERGAYIGSLYWGFDDTNLKTYDWAYIKYIEKTIFNNKVSKMCQEMIQCYFTTW